MHVRIAGVGGHPAPKHRLGHCTQAACTATWHLRQD
jgi:hypothetical protein